MRVINFKDEVPFFEELADFGSTVEAVDGVRATVSKVLAEIREQGDAAVARYTLQFDKAKVAPDDLRVAPADLQAAVQSLAAGDRAAIREAIRCVRHFHRQTLPKRWQGNNSHGARVGERFYPIRRVGLYIPGGNVPLVSTVVMTAVLAKLAGCQEIAVCTPPAADGSIAPAMLAALALAGVDEVYRVGGVQAIGAMAYGTASLPPVDKIFGPGNAYVIEAKRQVFGTVGIDLLPGPSEVLIYADSGANPLHIAADLLAQAEHGSGKERVFLVARGRRFIAEVERALEQLLPACRHADKIRTVLGKGALAIVVRSEAQAIQVINFLAPEHLELQVEAARIERLTQSITTAGAILQGYATPTVLGDFTAGPSHTLPTQRGGRFCSGLQLTDFMRRSSTVRYDDKSAAKAAKVVAAFARLEHLDAHGRSLSIRLEDQ